MEDILDKIVHCTEFSEFYMRRAERVLLNKMNENVAGKIIQYPIPSKITMPPQKVSW